MFAHLHTCDPVDGDTFHTSDAIGHYVLPPGLVSLGSTNSAQAHVNPVDGVIVYRAQEAQNTNLVAFRAIFRLNLWTQRHLRTTHQHGSQCPQQERCPTPVPGHQIYLMGPEECHGCPHARSRAKTSPCLYTKVQYTQC